MSNEYNATMEALRDSAVRHDKSIGQILDLVNTQNEQINKLKSVLDDHQQQLAAAWQVMRVLVDNADLSIENEMMKADQSPTEGD